MHAYYCTGKATLVGELVGQSRRHQQVIRHEKDRDGWEGGDCRRDGELQSTSTGLHQPSFLAFCLFDAHWAGSRLNPDVVGGKKEEKI